ncbi:MAG: hypothetical protein E7583_08975 [Ruminococcaceae bacterium]|nr:hypothetical protein [Oscillospiraceae bacterium]
MNFGTAFFVSDVLLVTINMQNGADIETFVDRSVVNIRKNQNPILVKFDVVGSLKGQKARKIDIDYGRGVENNVALAHSMPTSISISQLLDSVKGGFDDTLSKYYFYRCILPVGIYLFVNI